MSEQQRVVVRDLLAAIGPTEVRHGDCRGSDEQFHQLAASTGTIRITIHPPENPALRAWCKGDEVLDPLPYLLRNRAIVAASNLLLATPASALVEGGTWHTIGEAIRMERRTIIVHRDGRVVDR
jgi:hypothetical protein